MLAVRIDECVEAATADERRRKTLYDRAVVNTTYWASGMTCRCGQQLMWNPEIAWFDEVCADCRREWCAGPRQMEKLLLCFYQFSVLTYIGLLFVGSGIQTLGDFFTKMCC